MKSRDSSPLAIFSMDFSDDNSQDKDEEFPVSSQVKAIGRMLADLKRKAKYHGHSRIQESVAKMATSFKEEFTTMECNLKSCISQAVQEIDGRLEKMEMAMQSTFEFGFERFQKSISEHREMLESFSLRQQAERDAQLSDHRDLFMELCDLRKEIQGQKPSEQDTFRVRPFRNSSGVPEEDIPVNILRPETTHSAQQPRSGDFSTMEPVKHFVRNSSTNGNNVAGELEFAHESILHREDTSHPLSPQAQRRADALQVDKDKNRSCQNLHQPSGESLWTELFEAQLAILEAKRLEQATEDELADHVGKHTKMSGNHSDNHGNHSDKHGNHSDNHGNHTGVCTHCKNSLYSTPEQPSSVGNICQCQRQPDRLVATENSNPVNAVNEVHQERLSDHMLNQIECLEQEDTNQDREAVSTAGQQINTGEQPGTAELNGPPITKDSVGTVRQQTVLQPHPTGGPHQHQTAAFNRVKAPVSAKRRRQPVHQSIDKMVTVADVCGQATIDNMPGNASVSAGDLDQDADIAVNSEKKSEKQPSVASERRRSRRQFSEIDVLTLVSAVEQLGKGRWQEVKERWFLHDKHRTPTDLKDKWRSLVRAAKHPLAIKRGVLIPASLTIRILRANRI